MPAQRSDRAVLEILGQLFRYDLSESYGLLPNPDGHLQPSLARPVPGRHPERQAWLIKVAGGLGGYVMTRPIEDGGTSITDFFVVRALRRTGVGRTAAKLTIAQRPGRWHIAFQRCNPGSQVVLDPDGDRGGRRRLDDARRPAGRGPAAGHLDLVLDLAGPQ